jgi:hypothetical protein
LERRLRQLQQQESEARNKANSLKPVQEKDQRRKHTWDMGGKKNINFHRILNSVIHEKAQEIADREAELNQAQQQLQHELEQKRTIELNTREMISNEAESLKRANELLARLARERERELISGTGFRDETMQYNFF